MASTSTSRSGPALSEASPVGYSGFSGSDRFVDAQDRSTGKPPRHVVSSFDTGSAETSRQAGREDDGLSDRQRGAKVFQISSSERSGASPPLPQTVPGERRATPSGIATVQAGIIFVTDVQAAGHGNSRTGLRDLVFDRPPPLLGRPTGGGFRRRPADRQRQLGAFVVFSRAGALLPNTGVPSHLRRQAPRGSGWSHPRCTG